MSNAAATFVGGLIVGVACGAFIGFWPVRIAMDNTFDRVSEEVCGLHNGDQRPYAEAHVKAEWRDDYNIYCWGPSGYERVTYSLNSNHTPATQQSTSGALSESCVGEYRREEN